MTGVWWVSIQVALDFILLGLIILLAWSQKKTTHPVLDMQTSETWKNLLKQFEILEARILEKSQEMDRELKVLQKICERAEKTLQKVAFLPLGSDTSIEAQELKDSLHTNFSAPIPRLEDLEKTSQNLPSSLKLDLRTVLREQLA